MKFLSHMKPASPALESTARRAVFRERASPKPYKSDQRSVNPLRQLACALKSARPGPSVSRTAVRFGSQPPQTCPNSQAAFHRVRNRLILNRKIKAQTASNPRS
jgi:hypothetical protein